jgi:hypothetical protein
VDLPLCEVCSSSDLFILLKKLSSFVINNLPVKKYENVGKAPYSFNFGSI